MEDLEKKELEELLEYICCPKCSGDLVLIKKDYFYFYLCNKCNSEYKIKDGIPILL